MMDNDFAQRTRHLINVAQGREPAHLAILHATLANVYTGEWLEDQAICVWDRWIAYVGRNPGRAIGPDTTLIDAQQKPVIPGFIDAHTHLSERYTADAFLKHVIPGGTTAIVTEIVEPYAVGGYSGVLDFLQSLADQPIHLLGTAPPCISISSNFPPISIDDLQRCLARPDIIGLGESFWQAVLNAPDEVLPIFEATIANGKLLQGHSAGASDQKLNAYVASGILSCHEPINAQEAIERLRLGLYVMIREGSIRRDLEDIAKLQTAHIDSRRLILVTDGITANDLLKKGYMEYVVQKAIDLGFSSMEAIQMASLNPAVHFGLDRLIGGIAPGRYADMALLPDVSTMKPELVICKGKIIARNGQCVATPRSHAFLPQSLDSVHLPRALKAHDFQIFAQPGRKEALVRVIDMKTELVSSELQLTMPIENGQIMPDISQDIIKIAAINRSNNPGQKFVGLVRGFGLTSGAFACTTGWDLGDIVVIGASDSDMAEAVNRLHTLHGGVLVCRNGNIIAELPLPIMGLMTKISIPELATAIDTINASLKDLGNAFSDPLLALSALTGAAIPFLRICEQGLFNLKSGPCPLIVSA